MGNSTVPSTKPKKKARGGSWKKGQSGNPEGARKHLPSPLKQFKEICQKQFLRSLQQYGLMTDEQLHADLARPDITQFEKLFCGLVTSAVNGDNAARHIIMDRLWGKVKDNTQVKEEEPTARVVVGLPDNGRSSPNS